MDDFDLLREYARQASQNAFAQLVRRYLDLVYSAALRQVRDRHLADDVTQAVFVVLSKKAGRISSKVPLSAWLLSATRFAARDALKMESRRRKHEQRAAKMITKAIEHNGGADDEKEWQAVSAILDDAIAKLGESSRSAVALRFFEGKSFKDVGDRLGISELAAKQRVFRAMEKLRAIFARRGVILPSAGALAVVIASRGVEAAPAALGATVSAGVVAPMGGGVAMAHGALRAMAWAEAKLLAGYVAIVLLVGGGLLYRQHSTPETNLANDGAGRRSVPVALMQAVEKKSGIVSPIVQDAEGKVLGGAEVVVSTVSHPITFSGPLPDSSAVFTGADGRANLHAILEPAVIAIRHDSGYAEINADQLAETVSVRLLPWATVTGTVIGGSQPIPRAQVLLKRSEGTGDRRRPRVFYDVTTRADGNGQFVFTKLPPVRFGIFRTYRQGETIPKWIEPAAGRTIEIELGAGSRTVAGQITSPAGFAARVPWEGDIRFAQDATLYIAGAPTNPTRLPSLWFSPLAREMFERAWLASDAGSAWETSQHAATFTIDADGGFLIEGLAPGRYRMRALLYEVDPDVSFGEPAIRVEAPINVNAAENAQDADLPIKLPPLQSANLPRLTLGQSAPEFELATAEGKTIKLSDYRGRYVLVFRWGPARLAGEWEEDLPYVREIAKRFAADKRVLVLGVGFDGEQSELASRTKSDPAMIWGNGCGELIPPSEFRSCYGNVLIDPQGRVVAKNLRGSRIVEYVVKCLK